MSESNSFEQIFSSMTPLRPEQRGQGKESAKKTAFRMSVSGGEPAISILNGCADKNDLENRIVNLSRLLDTKDYPNLCAAIG